MWIRSIHIEFNTSQCNNVMQVVVLKNDGCWAGKTSHVHLAPEHVFTIKNLIRSENISFIHMLQGHNFIDRTLKCTWGPGTCSKLILMIFYQIFCFSYMFRDQIHRDFSCAATQYL